MTANELRAELVRRNTSVRELAKRIGMSQVTMWRRLKNPGTFKLSEIRAIQEALGLDAERVQALFFSDSFFKETRGA